MNKKNIVVVSPFDGMSCGRLALQKIPHLNVLRYYSMEIKDFAIEVANEHFPEDMKYRLGDITKIDGNLLREEIERDFGDVPILLIGGSPCQNLSGANSTREGLEGEKSILFYDLVRLKEELDPTYFLVENVRMKKDQELLFNESLGCTPITHNSSIIAPQLRHRLYWTNIPQTVQLLGINIKLNEVLVNGYSDRDKARALLESDSRPLSTPIKMVHRYWNTGFTTLIFKSEEHYNKIKEHFDHNFKGKSAKDIDSLIIGMDLTLYNGVRYMTNREREACQTVPLGYTDNLTQSQASSLLGDGWTVKVISHILRQI